MQKLRPRWMILTLGLVFVLLLALAVPAAAVRPPDSWRLQRLTWHKVANWNSDSVLPDPVPGRGTINTPRGTVAMVINGHVKLQPNTTYGVWVRELTGYTGTSLASAPTAYYYRLATFTTNIRGWGAFHIHIARTLLPNDLRNIQIAINTSLNPGDVGGTVAATVRFTPVRTGWKSDSAAVPAGA
jgi:hypothetical protein